MKKVTILFIAITFAICSFGQADISDYTFAKSTETYDQFTDGYSFSPYSWLIFKNNETIFSFYLAEKYLETVTDRLYGKKTYDSEIKIFGLLQVQCTGSSSPSPYNSNNLSASAAGSPAICPLWDNDFTYWDGDIRHKKVGTAPYRILKLQMDLGIDENNKVSVQLWLYESTNVIEFRYGPMTGSVPMDASIGVVALDQDFISINDAGTSTSSSTSYNNCNYPGNGTVYTLSPPSDDDAGIIDINSPQNYIGITGEYDIKVELKNFSNASLDNCDIEWWVNEVPQTTFEWTGSLANTETEEVNIGTYDFSTLDEDYVIRVRTNNPNGNIDFNTDNDEFTTTIHTYSPLSIPYEQDFNEAELNGYWYIDAVDSDRAWYIETPDDPNDDSFDGTNYIRIQDDWSFEHTDYLYTPMFDATNLNGILYVGWEQVMNTNEYFPETEYLSLEVYHEATWHEIFKSTDEYESFDDPVDFYLSVNDYISENFQLRFKYVGNTTTGGTAIPIWNIDNFHLDIVIENDLGLEYTGPAFGHPEQPIYPRAIIKNYAALVANDFSVTIEIGDYSSTKEITGANLEYNDTIIVTMPDAWTPTETGNASVSSFITYAADENSDNNTATGTAKIMEEFTQAIYYQVTEGGNSSFVIAELDNPTSYTTIRDDMFPETTVGGTYIEETEQIYMATKRNLWDIDIYNGIAFGFSDEDLVLSEENHFENVWIQGISYNETNSTMYLTVADLPIISNHLFTADLTNKTVTDVSTDTYWGNDYYGRILAIGSDVNGDVFAIRAQNAYASPPTYPVINQLILPEGEESDTPIQIGEINLGISNDIEFDKTTNTCYFLKSENVAKDDYQTTLNIINTETAQITQIGDFGTNTDITGLIVTPSIPPVQVTFNVTDAVTTDPINNAKVSINNQDHYTDVTGSVTFEIMSGTYTYTVSADNYMAESEEIIIEEETTVDVELYQAIAVNFTVTDINTSVGIDGAIVRINDIDYETADGGLVTIFLISDNDYDYTVTNYAYQTIEGNFSLENTPLDIEVEMIPLKQLTFTVYQTGTSTTLENVDINVTNGADDWNETTSSNGQAIFYLINGNYQYIASLSGYSTEEDYIEVNQDVEIDIYLDLLSNINNIDNNYFKIYPNPSNGIFTIQNNSQFQNSALQGSTNSQPVPLQREITITDITGKIILNSQFSIFNSQFSIKEKGIYLINIRTETGIYTQKLIIQ